MSVNGETCSRVREGLEGKTGEAPARPVYLYDFNDDGMGGTEDHPYFTITSGEAGLFAPGEVYARIEIEEKSGLVGRIGGEVAGDPPVEGEEDKPDAPEEPSEPVLGTVADEPAPAAPKRSHSRKPK